MLKRTIHFEDFDGNPTSEDFYFNLSKSELIVLEASYEKGLAETIKAIVAANDVKTLIAEFQKLILLSYGEKSADGKRFIKNEQLRDEFTQTPAYDALFMELATDDQAAAVFVNGLMPRDLGEQVAQIQEASVETLAAFTPVLPPPPPAA
jgi:hypothetical protein